MPRPKPFKQSEKRDAGLGIWAWASAIFGGITWLASNGNLVGVLDFLDRLARYWRDGLRDLWAAFFSFIQFPYSFTPEQRDTLTMLAICASIIVRVYVVKPSPRRLFRISPLADVEGWRENLESFACGIATSVMMTLFITPFVDQEYYATNGSFWGFVFGIVTAVAFGLYVTIHAIELFRTPPDKRKRPIDWLRRRDGRLTPWFAIERACWLTIRLAVGVVGGPWIALHNWSALVEQDYWLTFSSEDFVSIMLLAVLAVAVVLVLLRTLRPLFRILAVGLVLAAVGFSAGRVRAVYEKYFISAAPAEPVAQAAVG